MSEQYIYQVARVRARELSLLTRQDLDQLLACRGAEECLRVLADKGWGDGSAVSAEALLAAEERKTWAFMEELVGDLSPFAALLLPTDYNNLKAAIKCVTTDTQPKNVFLPGGTLDPELLMNCVRENDFSPLPEDMREPADKAYHTLLQTGDGQLCDVILDRACLESQLLAGDRAQDELPRAYAREAVAVADIKIAVRACKTGKSLDFLTAALAPCPGLDTQGLAKAACGSVEDLYAFLLTTPYGEAVEKLRESYSAFELWCDGRIMALIRDQKYNPFTLGPLFAYVLARRGEIASVRIILSGKLNGLDEDLIRERVRDTYV